eukprot:1143356-Pelagomonas_calceolata.AAC.4
MLLINNGRSLVKLGGFLLSTSPAVLSFPGMYNQLNLNHCKPTQRVRPLDKVAVIREKFSMNLREYVARPKKNPREERLEGRASSITAAVSDGSTLMSSAPTMCTRNFTSGFLNSNSAAISLKFWLLQEIHQALTALQEKADLVVLVQCKCLPHGVPKAMSWPCMAMQQPH